MEDNKAIIRRFYDEVINRRHLAVLDEMLALTFEGFKAEGADHASNCENFKHRLFRTLRAQQEREGGENRLGKTIDTFSMREGCFLGKLSLNALLHWFLGGSTQWLSTGSAEEPIVCVNGSERKEVRTRKEGEL